MNNPIAPKGEDATDHHPRQPGPAVRVDLTGVTVIEAAGKAFLAAAHARGAELVAPGCLMKAVVAEITRAPLPDRGQAGE